MIEENLKVEKEIRERFNPSKEICGFVMFDNELIQIKNISNSAIVHYVMDPVEQIHAMEKGPVKIIWHTHPNNAAIPSYIDKSNAKKNMLYLIYSGLNDDFRLWFYDGDKFIEKEW